MLTSDDFVIIVPRDGLPFITEPGADLSEYVNDRFFRVKQTVALKNGRSIHGSVFRGRDTDATDQLVIQDQLNQGFAKK